MWFLQVFTLHFSYPSQGQGFFSIPAQLTICITRSFANSVEFGQIMLPLFYSPGDILPILYTQWHLSSAPTCQRFKILSLSQPLLQFQTAIPLPVPQFSISPTAQNPCLIFLKYSETHFKQYFCQHRALKCFKLILIAWITWDICSGRQLVIFQNPEDFGIGKINFFQPQSPISLRNAKDSPRKFPNFSPCGASPSISKETFDTVHLLSHASLFVLLRIVTKKNCKKKTRWVGCREVEKMTRSW